MEKSKRKWKVVEIALAIGLLAAMLWGAWSLRAQQALAEKVVRLHILANSDSQADQNLKLEVRDAVLDEAEGVLRNVDSRTEAETALRQALPTLQALAEREIQAEGYDYPVTAELRETSFPTREYDTFTLPAGEYLALRLVIGAGEGHNWWCVVFPPLCAQATTDVAQTAMADGLSEKDVKLITEENGGYVLKFKSIEIWEKLKEKLAGTTPRERTAGGNPGKSRKSRSRGWRAPWRIEDTAEQRAIRGITLGYVCSSC